MISPMYVIGFFFLFLRLFFLTEEMARLPDDSSKAIIPHAGAVTPLSSVPSGNTEKRKAKAIMDAEPQPRNKSLRTISSGPNQKTLERSSFSEKPKRKVMTDKIPTPTTQSKRIQTKKLAGSSGGKPTTKVYLSSMFFSLYILFSYYSLFFHCRKAKEQKLWMPLKKQKIKFF